MVANVVPTEQATTIIPSYLPEINAQLDINYSKPRTIETKFRPTSLGIAGAGLPVGSSAPYELEAPRDDRDLKVFRP